MPETLAGLQGHDSELIERVGFTPDGTRLLVSGPGGIIRTWDLRQVREQLAGRGLDWDQPAYPPAPPVGDVKPVRVEVNKAAYERLANSYKCFQEGQAHAKAGRWAQAVEAYSRALDLDPAHAWAYTRRGYAYNQQRQWDKAIADSTQAIKLAADLWTPWSNRGFAHHRLKQWDRALGDFSEALKLSPGNAVLWGNRAGIYRELRDWHRAVADYTRAIELKATEPSFWVGRAAAHAELGEWAKADADLAWLAGWIPEPVRVLHRCALLRLTLQDAGGYRKVCTSLARAIDKDLPPASASLALWTCALAADAGVDVTRLVPPAEQAVARQPKDPRALLALGAVLYRAGRFAEAARRLEESEAAFAPLGNLPGDIVPVRLLLVMAHHRLGHAKEARQWLDRAVEVLPLPAGAEGQAPAVETWDRRLTVQLLRREAAALLRP